MMASLPATDTRLHTAKDAKTIRKLASAKDCDVNARDENGDAPIHAIIRAKNKHKFECLLALLVHSNANVLDIDATSADDNTALHLAVMENEVVCMKALLAFGADINSVNALRQTPLDIALESMNMELVTQYLSPLGAFQGEYVIQQLHEAFVLGKVPLDTRDEKSADPQAHVCMPVNLKEHQGKRLHARSGKLVVDVSLPSVVKQIQEMLLSPSRTTIRGTTIGALRKQLREVQRMAQHAKGSAHTQLTPLVFNVHGGERILCLDGGGIKGLIQVEVLMQIEEMTGRRIVELFDWIVGTSIGGIIALGMVYSKMTLPELRKLYFELKEDVFTKYGCNTKKQEAIIQKYLGMTTRLTDVSHPKVMITAVDGRDTNLELRFFNNCFFDAFSDELVWKVARYTSAAPFYFEPLDHYLDGGLKANNPTAYALTKIQSFLDEQAAISHGQKARYACVVSVGCGIYPPKKLENLEKLVLGLHWLNPAKLKEKLKIAVKLMCSAIAESEGVADNCRSRCEKQKIPFYRFSPPLDEVIALNEEDDEKLCGMILKAKMFLQSMDYSMDELVQSFYHSTLFTEEGKPKF